MPGYTETAKHTGLDAIVARITHLSIHTASPGTTGDNEVSGGGYARVARTAAGFDAASGGARALTADAEFSGPANEDATHFGVWDESTFLGGGAISGDTAFNAEGDFTLQAGTALDLNA